MLPDTTRFCRKLRPTRFTSESRVVLTLLGSLERSSLEVPSWHRVEVRVFASQMLYLGWQDNNIVFSLSIVYIVYNVINLVKRERRRSNKTSINTAIAYKPFEDAVYKKLKIPIFIDKYNYNIGGIDLVHQYRAAYKTYKSVFRSWFCILWWRRSHIT
jgi:hypothetical protein